MARLHPSFRDIAGHVQPSLAYDDATFGILRGLNATVDQMTPHHLALLTGSFSPGREIGEWLPSKHLTRPMDAYKYNAYQYNIDLMAGRKALPTRVAVLDIETTGLLRAIRSRSEGHWWRGDDITEIGIRGLGGTFTETWDDIASKKLQSLGAQAPGAGQDITDVLKSFLHKISQEKIQAFAGHNIVTFDLPWLDDIMRMAKLHESPEFKPLYENFQKVAQQSIDTRLLFAGLAQDADIHPALAAQGSRFLKENRVTRLSLSNIRAWLGITEVGEHTAGEDVILTEKVLQRLFERIKTGVLRRDELTPEQIVKGATTSPNVQARLVDDPLDASIQISEAQKNLRALRGPTGAAPLEEQAQDILSGAKPEGVDVPAVHRGIGYFRPADKVAAPGEYTVKITQKHLRDAGVLPESGRIPAVLRRINMPPDPIITEARPGAIEWAMPHEPGLTYKGTITGELSVTEVEGRRPIVKARLAGEQDEWINVDYMRRVDDQGIPTGEDILDRHIQPTEAIHPHQYDAPTTHRSMGGLVSVDIDHLTEEQASRLIESLRQDKRISQSQLDEIIRRMEESYQSFGRRSFSIGLTRSEDLAKFLYEWGMESSFGNPAMPFRTVAEFGEDPTLGRLVGVTFEGGAGLEDQMARLEAMAAEEPFVARRIAEQAEDAEFDAARLADEVKQSEKEALKGLQYEKLGEQKAAEHLARYGRYLKIGAIVGSLGILAKTLKDRREENANMAMSLPSGYSLDANYVEQLERSRPDPLAIADLPFILHHHKTNRFNMDPFKNSFLFSTPF